MVAIKSQGPLHGFAVPGAMRAAAPSHGDLMGKHHSLINPEPLCLRDLTRHQWRDSCFTATLEEKHCLTMLSN